MPTESSAIVQKLWNYCNVLRDDGVSYGDYVEQLTYLVFLKMADELTKPPYNNKSTIPKEYNWQSIAGKDGIKLTGFGLPSGAQAPYGAPELARGPAMAASDQYSLAVCFREMTAAGEPVSGLEKVLERALTGEPGKRYGSCAELAAAVAALRSTRMR